MRNGIFRAFTVFVAACLVGGLFGYSAPKASAAEDYSDIKIGVTLLSIAEMPFFQIVQSGIEAGVAKYPGIKATILDGQSDSNVQFDQVQNFIAQGYTAIFDAPVDANSTTTTVELAKKEGVPFFFLNTHGQGEADCVIATDDILGGNLAADYADKYLQGKGNVALLCWPELGNTNNRGIGFEEGLKKYPGLKLVDKQSYLGDANKAASLAEDMLTKNPDIDLFFCVGEPSALAAVEVIKAMGSDCVVIGYDGNPEAIIGIKESPGIWIADIAQDPKGQGEMAVDLLVKLKRGEKIDKEVLVEPYIMDLDYIKSKNL
jgi:ribose transport system substrate-binding protein